MKQVKNTTMKKSIMIPALVFLLSQLVFAQNPQWVYYGHNMPQGSGFVRCIATDSSGTIMWFGLWTGGLLKFDGTSWTHYDTTNSSLPCNDMISITVSDDNIVYATCTSPGEHLVIKFDGTKSEKFNTSNSNIMIGPYLSVSSGPDYLLIGGGYGVSVMDKKTNTFTNYTTTNSGLPWNIVPAVKAEGHVKWIGTTARGLARFDDTTWTIYNSTNSGLITNNVVKIQITPDGLKWIVCRDGGINRFNSETNQWDAYFLGAGVSRAGAVDYTTGNMACEQTFPPPFGLRFYRASDSTYHFFNYTNSPLPDGSSITSLEFDKYGNLWMGGEEFIYNPNGVVGIDNSSTIITEIPQDFKLYQNFPNPFNPSTTIKYEVTKRSSITLRVYNINGKLVKILDSGYKPIGEYEINFDGNGLPSGVYFYRLETDSYHETRLMVLIK